MSRHQWAISGDGACVLRAAKVARVLLDVADSSRLLVDAEGFSLVDISLDGGRIASVQPTGATDCTRSIDLGGSQVWPCFADLHAHLDKGHIARRAVNPDGTGPGAFLAVAYDRATHWSAADVVHRFEFGLRSAYAHGTSALRTHIDSASPQAAISWPVFQRMQQRWQGRIALQGVAMAGLDVYLSDEGDKLADLVQRSGGSALGGATRIGGRTRQDPSVVEAGLDRIFALATAHGLDVDLHVDENGDPSVATLHVVAEAVLRNDFQGQVICGHCCSLAMQSDSVADKTIARCRDAGLAVVSLPMANLYLQGRVPGRTPRWRGVTLVHELRAAGVPVAFASDNCCDPFFAFGDLDMLEVYREAVRIAHLDMPYGEWPAAVSATPARLMREPERGVVRAGAPADLVLFQGRGMGELLSRPESGRLVLRDGKPVDAVPPEYCELDGLAGMPGAAN